MFLISIFFISSLFLEESSVTFAVTSYCLVVFTGFVSSHFVHALSSRISCHHSFLFFLS
jgi:hypothetical protein